MPTALFDADLIRAEAMLIGPTSALRHVIAECIASERERCAQIAEAIDSGRGNEKEIARAIRSAPHTAGK